MSIEDMRGWVASAYKTKSWKAKVSKMPDNQILALYFRFAQQGKFNK